MKKYVDQVEIVVNETLKWIIIVIIIKSFRERSHQQFHLLQHLIGYLFFFSFFYPREKYLVRLFLMSLK